MINKPWDAFTCRSSTLTILAYSGPSHALLLTVLGVPERFPRLRIPGCVYVSSVVNTHSFGQFWPVSWTITHHFWGPKVISMVVEPQGVLTCWSLRLVVCVDSGPFLGLLLTVLGVPKRFSWLSNPRVCLRVGFQDLLFGPILARFLDYYLVLGSRSDFRD